MTDLEKEVETIRSIIEKHIWKLPACDTNYDVKRIQDSLELDMLRYFEEIRGSITPKKKCSNCYFKDSNDACYECFSCEGKSSWKRED